MDQSLPTVTASNSGLRGHLARFALITIGFAVLFAWISFGQLYPKPEARTDKALFTGKIVLGHSNWPGYFIWQYAQHTHMFRDAGLDVDIVKYASLSEISRDFKSGKLTGRSGPTFDIAREYLEGVDQKIVAAIDHSNGADNIVARNDIMKIGDFKGKRVAYEFDTLTELIIADALNRAGLKLEDIIAVNASAKKAVELLADGQADIAVTYEPFGSNMEKTGNFHIMYSTKDAPGLVSDALTFSGDFVKAHPETVSRILDLYFLALEKWKAEPREALETAAAIWGTTPENFAKDLEGITILDRDANRSAFAFTPGFESVYGNMRRMEVFYREHHPEYTAQKDIDTAIEPHFIRN